MKQTLKDKILHLLDNKKNVILGLSGGPDSVFLFYILKEMHEDNLLNLVCAHFNHRFRSNSDNDESFCVKLCAKYGIKIITGHNDSGKDKENGSQEAFGRKLRRNFFKSLSNTDWSDTGSPGKDSVVALAHHADDQQETFFLRLIRGSTLNGLTIMKERSVCYRQVCYIRPLLGIYKKDIVNYLNINALEYVNDESNHSDLFLRNRIRKYVLPALKKSDDRFDKKFADTLYHLNQEDKFLQKITSVSYNNIFSTTTKGDLKKFLDLDLVLQKRILILLLSGEKCAFSPSNKYLEEIIRFIKSPNPGSHKLHPSWEIRKTKNFFEIKSI